MEIYCPPTKISPLVNDATLVHVCKSKAYKGEAFLMPRIGAVLIKKLLSTEFGVDAAAFDELYKGRGICVGYYPIVAERRICIAGGKVFDWIDGGAGSEITDEVLLHDLLAFFAVGGVSELPDAPHFHYFKLSESRRFAVPKRTKYKNNTYSSDFYFKEIEGDLLPTGEEKQR